MKRRIISRRENMPVEEDFYEAMPAAEPREVYREEPVYVEDDYGRDRVSGWVILGIIVLALALLLLLFGRGLGSPSGGQSLTAPTTPTPSTPATR